MERVERNNKTGKVIGVLILIIVLLLAVVVYTLLIKPQFNAYVIEKQTETAELVLNTLLLQVQQQGYVQITDFETNQTVVLVPYNPEQA